MHDLDAYKTAEEEARRQLNKNVESNIEQVLAATPHKTPAVRPLAPIKKTIQVRRARHAGHCWRSKDELSVMYSYGTSHMTKQKQDDQLEHTYSSYVRIRDVAQKTCQKRWMIGRSGKRGSGISMLVARHDDDDDSCISLTIQLNINYLFTHS